MNALTELLKKKGPLTGKELHENSPSDIVNLWRLCNACEDIALLTVGTRYLRLDKHVEGFARLSPSILREFCNYTVVCLKDQVQDAREKARRIGEEIVRISRDKQELARTLITRIVEGLQDAAVIRDGACFMIAGDVAYEMAHLEPRPESSTGEFVNGSDLDIVVVVRDLPEDTVRALDEAIYAAKHFLLNNPGHKEEIDYIVKDVSRVREQLEFSDFKQMVACKVLEESLFLYGNEALFREIKRMLRDRGIPDKLAALLADASEKRENARRQYLAFDDAADDEDMHHLLYTTEEREEFY